MSNSREIIKSLIMDKKCPERMGLYEHFWSETLGEWEKQGYPKGVNPDDYFNYDLCFSGGWFDNGAICGQNITVEETADTRVYTYAFGEPILPVRLF